MSPPGPLDRVFGAIVPRAVDAIDMDDVIGQVDVDHLVSEVDVDAIVRTASTWMPSCNASTSRP